MTREDAETLFDLMELYREEHPNCTDDEAFNGVCMWNLDKTEARIEALKEQRRERLIANA